MRKIVIIIIAGCLFSLISLQKSAAYYDAYGGHSPTYDSFHHYFYNPNYSYNPAFSPSSYTSHSYSYRPIGYKDYTKSYKKYLQAKVANFCTPSVFVKKRCESYCAKVENNNTLCDTKKWPKKESVTVAPKEAKKK
jgi:hypothetical protein